MKKNFLAIVIILSTLCSLLSAQQIMFKQESFTDSAIYEEDYIFAGGWDMEKARLTFDGKTEDLYFIGNELELNGETEQGLLGLGADLTVNGKVGNDLIAMGGAVTVNGMVRGTTFIGTGEFILANDGVINGDLFIGGGTVKIHGTVNGDLYAGAGVLTIDGLITGDVNAGFGDVVFTEKGRVNGNFTYSAEKELLDKENSKVGGIITFKENDFFTKKKMDDMDKFFGLGAFIFKLAGLVSILVLGLLLLLLPIMKNFDFINNRKQFWLYVLWGMIPFFLFPVLIVVSIIPIITIPLALILLCALVPLLVVSQILGATLLGQYLCLLFGWNRDNRHTCFFLGMAVMAILSFIPFINGLATLVFSCAGLGLIMDKVFKMNLGNNTEMQQ